MKHSVRNGFALRAAALALFVGALLTPAATVFAHGGEDHGDQKAPAVATGPGRVVHTARAGDLEVVVKHPPVEPDKEVVARVLVTRFATNEPVGDAKVTLVLAGEGGAPVEVTAAPSAATPGMYEAKFPPLPKNQYTLTASLDTGGKTETVAYGAIQVAPLPAASAGVVASWARSALIGLGLLAALGLAVFVVRRAVQMSQRDRLKGQTTAAA